MKLRYIGTRMAEKEQQQKKKPEQIYKKNTRAFALSSSCSRFFSFLLSSFSSSPCHPQLLIDTHLSSALRSIRPACEGEKVVISFFLFSSLALHTQARARVHTFTR